MNTNRLSKSTMYSRSVRKALQQHEVKIKKAHAIRITLAEHGSMISNNKILTLHKNNIVRHDRKTQKYSRNTHAIRITLGTTRKDKKSSRRTKYMERTRFWEVGHLKSKNTHARRATDLVYIERRSKGKTFSSSTGPRPKVRI